MASSIQDQMVPLGRGFSYFAGFPVAEEDLNGYLHDPIAALPPRIVTLLPEIGVALVPYLEKGAVRGRALAVHEAPTEPRRLDSARLRVADRVILYFGVRDLETPDYHYAFYNAVAKLVSERWTGEIEKAFSAHLRGELEGDVHGEVDDQSWRLKQNLMRRGPGSDSKPFRDYARQAFEDTLTLYLHGICCDIDVETGPRQMPSRYVRKRLELLHKLFPPPDGLVVFPEQLSRLSRS